MKLSASAEAQPTEAATIDRYLGPARVVRLEEGAVVVVIDSETLVHATLALAFPYRPVIGDQLLVIGDEQAFFVIGVLEGRGRSGLSNDAGVALSAESGRLRLVGDQGVRVHGRSVDVQTEELETVAIETHQTFGEQRKQVRGAIQTEAGQIDELSQGAWVTQAKRFILKCLNAARVKSNTVRLG
jgi:hypothetical protein